MATWTALSNQPSFSVDTMLLLTDGSVMAHELSTNRWHRLAPDDSGSYVNGSWSGLAALLDDATIPVASGGPTNAPLYFASAVFADGRVFVAGGEYNSTVAGAQDILTSQIYDPRFDSWTKISTPTGWTGIGDAATCVLADGRLLLAQYNGSATALYDPHTNLWTAGGAKGDSCSEETFTLLPNGNVLTVECSNIPNAEQYIPSSNTWVSAGNVGATLPQACAGFVAEIGPALLLNDGRVLAVGATGATALYTPDPSATLAGTWAAGPTLVDTSNNTSFPMDAPGVLLPAGRVLLVGSPAPPCSYPGPTTFHLYDPSTNLAAVVTGPPNNGGPAYTGRFLLLPTGQVLFSNHSNDIEVYTPDGSADAAWKPTITSCPTTLITGHTQKIFGTQFNGRSQACTYGDDAQMATNYPIVRLSNAAGKVVYLRTSDHSTMGVATGATIVSTHIAVPDDLAPGDWSLVVVANGIASDPFAVTVGTRDAFLLFDRSTFAIGEIQALINLSGAPATIENTVYVVVEGFSLAQVGATRPTMPSPRAGITLESAGPAIPQGTGLPATAVQRLTYPFRIKFADTSMFSATNSTLGLTGFFAADGSTAVAAGLIELLATPNPYILHGDVAHGKPWYLSVDLRVFTVAQGGRLFAATMGGGDPANAASAFITAALTNLNGHVASLGPAFDALPQDDEDAAALSLAPTDGGGTPIFNFAIARVRYRDVQVANSVRCLFRLWPAQQTNASYDANTTYRTGVNGTGQKVAVLGIDGDEIVTIPFFASPRVDNNTRLDAQPDPANVHDIDPDSLGGEVDVFFGCWLDINQPGDARFPPRLVGGNAANIPFGPYAGFAPLVSIQQLVRSRHQCLLAEISFDPDPIRAGADPSTSDKLAQRNLAFVNVPNPGVEPSRIAPQTFEIKPSPFVLKSDARPDELMIRWGRTPPGSRANFYLPGTTAAAVIDWEQRLYATRLITKLDDHTIQVPASGVTWLPIPQGGGANFAGLMSLELPGTVHEGDRYDIVVRQITSVEFGRAGGMTNGVTTTHLTNAMAATGQGKRITWRRTSGVFQLTIPIGTKRQLLSPEERLYAILLWIKAAIPIESRWYPVFQRYVAEIGGRVKGMGGDPNAIQPDGTGHVGPTPGGDDDDGGFGVDAHGRGQATGKVSGLVYDHFGDFAGFLVEVGCGPVLRFQSRECRVEALVRRAWAERATITVTHDRRHPHCPLEIIFGGIAKICCD
jgi:hypothetical protein